MGLLPLFCGMLLSSCSSVEATQSDELYNVRPWPKAPELIELQSQAAEYIVEGHAAYKSCTATIDIIRPKKDE